MPDRLTELTELARPLVEWLQKNFHPHCTILITQDSAELTESIMTSVYEVND